MSESKEQVAAALLRFKYEKLLNQGMLVDQNNQAAIVLVERTAFSKDEATLRSFVSSLVHIETLGNNDIYSWHLASTDSASPKVQDLKVNVICPCTPKHIAKYSEQGVRSVTETPEIYRDHVRPLMQKNRDDGRLNWVFQILDGKAEQEDVMYSKVSEGNDGFMLLPDLNWDRKTIPSLHCLGLCQRRDIWSLRDLTRAHVPWLKHMRQKLLDATINLYPQLEEDQLKLYVHYQPTYYHFHIHVVHVSSDPGMTQAVGKALGLDDIINQLEHMPSDDAGMASATLTYTLGEASELWHQVFEPLKRERQRLCNH